MSEEMENWCKEIVASSMRELGQTSDKLAVLPLIDHIRATFGSLHIILHKGVESRQKDVATQWEKEIKAAVAGASGPLRVCLDNLKNASPEAAAFWRKRIDEALSIPNALARLAPLGPAVQQLIDMTDAFDQKADELALTWKAIQADMQMMDKDLDAAVKSVHQTVEEAIEHAGRQHKSLYERGREVAAAIGALPGPTPLALLGESTAVVAKAVGVLAGTWPAVQAANIRLWQRCQDIRQEIAKRGVGITMFLETRAATEDFLEAVNLEKAVAAERQAANAVSAAVAACATKGQQEDFEEVGEWLMVTIWKAHEKLRHEHDDFVRHHKDVFFAGVSSKTVEILLDSDRFTEPLDDVEFSEYSSVLRTLYEFDHAQVCLTNYNGSERNALRHYLDDQFKDLYPKIQKEARELERIAAEMDKLIKDLKRLKDRID